MPFGGIVAAVAAVVAVVAVVVVVMEGVVVVALAVSAEAASTGNSTAQGSALLVDSSRHEKRSSLSERLLLKRRCGPWPCRTCGDRQFHGL
jgi:hypothetical protein